MPVISKSLTDALKQILTSLQIPFIFPAAVFVSATFLLYPGEIQVDDSTRAIVVATTTVVLSYLLYACNIPIIQLVEGYTLDQSWFFRMTHWFENKRYEKLQQQIDQCDTAIAELSLLRDKLFLCGLLTDPVKARLQFLETIWTDRRRPLRERMELRFPHASRNPLPTALGNTIAAFEDYPWVRYSMDAVHLWPRFLPILEEEKFTSFVMNEKAIFDFLLNMGLVILGVCFELLLLFGLVKPDFLYVLAISGLLIIAYVLYRGAIVAAVHWGGMVRVAFDLYRNDLRRALYLPAIPDESLEKERQLWEKVSSFLVFGEVGGDEPFKGFVYSRPQKKKEGATCGASG